MSDFESARTAMVDCQVRPSDVTLYPIIAAMLSVPREEFVPSAYREVAYADAAVPLGSGRAVLEPRTFSKMLDALALDKESLVLDIAPGLGYSTAVLSRIAAAVVAVEEDEDLARNAREALGEIDADNVLVASGNHVDGAAAHGPYDAVLINGAVETVPDDLIAQVKIGGRIVAIFMTGALGQCRIGVQTEKGVNWRNAFDATAPVLLGFEKAREFVF